MANACFRCKTPIDSGQTFCAGCSGEVSLDFAYERDNRVWVVVAVAPVLALAVLAAPTAAAAIPGVEVPGLTYLLAYPLAIAFAYALYSDCGHVRRRDDAEWTPSSWGYAALAVFSAILIVPMFLAAPYHLFRRNRAIGLVLRPD